MSAVHATTVVLALATFAAVLSAVARLLGDVASAMALDRVRVETAQRPMNTERSAVQPVRAARQALQLSAREKMFRISDVCRRMQSERVSSVRFGQIAELAAIAAQIELQAKQAGMGPLQAAAHDLREQCDGTLRSTDTEPGIGTHLKGAYVLLSEMGVILGVPPGNQ